MPGDVNCEAVEINGRLGRARVARVCEDIPARVCLNGTLAGSFEACQAELDDLACGFLLCEGLIGAASDIESISVRDGDVFVKAKAGDVRKAVPGKAFEVNALVLLERYCAMDAYSPMRLRTGGNHSAAIFTSAGGVLAYAEDAQRQGALCKAVGKAASLGYDLGDCYLMATGRVTPWSVNAVCRAGMPLLASFGVPTAKAVEAARRSDLTLVTIAGLSSVVIFSGAGRIVGLPGEDVGLDGLPGLASYR